MKKKSMAGDRSTGRSLTLKRMVMVLSITIASLVSIGPLKPTHGIVLSAVELGLIDAPDTPAMATGETQAGKGNGVLNALGSPFRAIGRLFGHGKKDNNKLQRISEKDIKKFENRKVTPAPVTQVTTPQPADDIVATCARDHLNKGRALLNSGDVNAAITELTTAASLDPKLSEAHTLLGVAYNHKGLTDMARQSFETALQLPGDEAMHLNNLGFLEYKNGNYHDALKYLKRAVKLAANDARIWNNLGRTQIELGKFDDACRSFVHAVGEFDGQLNVVRYLEAKGQHKEAVKHLEKARALRPNSLEVLARLPTLYESVGNHNAAVAANDSLLAARRLAAVPKQ